MVAIPNVGGGGFMLGETYLKEKGRQDALALERQRLALQRLELDRTDARYYAGLEAQKTQARNAATADLGSIRNAGRQAEFADAAEMKKMALSAQLTREGRAQEAQLTREGRKQQNEQFLTEQDRASEQADREFALREANQKTAAEKLLHDKMVEDARLDLDERKMLVASEDRRLAIKGEGEQKTSKAIMDAANFTAAQLKSEAAQIRNTLKARPQGQTVEMVASRIMQAQAKEAKAKEIMTKALNQVAEMSGVPVQDLLAMGGEAAGPRQPVSPELAENPTFNALDPDGQDEVLALMADFEARAKAEALKTQEAQENQNLRRQGLQLNERRLENEEDQNRMANLRKQAATLSAKSLDPSATLGQLLDKAERDPEGYSELVLNPEIQFGGPAAKSVAFLRQSQVDPDLQSIPGLNKEILNAQKYADAEAKINSYVTKHNFPEPGSPEEQELRQAEAIAKAWKDGMGPRVAGASAQEYVRMLVPAKEFLMRQEQRAASRPAPEKAVSDLPEKYAWQDDWKRFGGEDAGGVPEMARPNPNDLVSGLYAGSPKRAASRPAASGPKPKAKKSGAVSVESAQEKLRREAEQRKAERAAFKRRLEEGGY